MNKRGSDSLALLNSAVALVILIPILLMAVSVERENVGHPGQGPGPQPGDDQPPIIVLRESEGYSFPSGSAELSVEFREKLLKAVVPTLRSIIGKYQCDIVEVVGHTDSQRVAERSTTDADLLAFAQGANVSVSPGSNADLGLLRAWSVIRSLRENAPWGTIVFYGYSAGQLIGPAGRIVEAKAPTIDPDRRRIEIRVWRSH
jgi:outer membrane protein OmpA-like peptidoglycan-associated protein